MKSLNVFVAGVALSAGSAFADLSIERECDADEGRGKDGFFIVSRGADDPVTKPIKFVFSVSGTAKPGWTYCSLWGDECIPAGEKSVRIRIIPLDDPETKEDATVTLTLQPSTGAYTVDPKKGEATLKVLNGAIFGGHNRRDAGPWNFIAHKGAGEGRAPENSQAAVEAAVRDGFGFENDLQITKDGRFYISHDPKADISGLADFKGALKLMKPGVLYKVDCKCGSPGIDRILEELKATDAVKRGGLLAFNFADAAGCRRIVREAPGVEAWMSMAWRRGQKYDSIKEATRIVAWLKDGNCKGISLQWNEQVCTKEFFDILNDAGITVDIWTIDDMRTAKKAINLGARWVTTNAPRRLANELPPANPPAMTFTGCDPNCSRMNSLRVGALDASAWASAQWLSATDAPVYDGPVKAGMNSAPGTSWFVSEVANASAVKSVRWMTAGLGVYEVYVNGQPVGCDFLKPGFTHHEKTKYAFTYDVTKLLKAGAGEKNVFSVEVSSGWWRDKIVSPENRSGGFAARKSAFRGVLEFTFADGTKRLYGTNAKDWKAGIAGSVVQAGIFDGEVYDARLKPGYECDEALKTPEVNEEFKGELLPTLGAEVCLRHDLVMNPVKAYVWEKTKDASDGAFGTVVNTRTYAADDTMRIAPGEKLVLDFGQNAAAVPFFRFLAKRGTVLTALPAEMLNDGNGEKKRGNDGPEGSVYRVNLRSGHETGRLVKYTFAGAGLETYSPRFTYFGYRYMSVSATDEVEFETIRSIPVSSIRKDMELGSIETGSVDVNRLIRNVYWGQLSNYLSVPTDCPQRDERLGWTADTQVFCEAGTFNADTRDFFCKWMRDLRDTQGPKGGFPGVAPLAQTGDIMMRFGWADAGVIVPYQIWKQFGDVRIIDENWSAMERFMARAEETKYRTENLPECHNYQWSDWLSLTKYESHAYRPELSARQNGKLLPEALRYWDYLGGCYWFWDAQRMAEMAAATGRDASVKRYLQMAGESRAYLKAEFFTSDGSILPIFRGMQTPALFALKLGLVEGAAKDTAIADLRASIAAGGGTLHTGFLGTSIVMDTLTENGMADVAYALLFNHKFPGWLYSVDQGATTIWERWNSYTKEKGFGPAGMNSFNHYAYGAVLAWIYKTAAGIAADPKNPGFKNVIMAPKPNRRLGFVKAEYRSAAGLIKSAWHYKDKDWVWEFTIPEGATADVTLPGESAARRFESGTHVLSMVVDSQ